MMWWSLVILHLTVLNAVLCSASVYDPSICPQMCICRTSDALDEVTCHDLNLTSVPRGLPSSVVRLDLANNTLTVLDVSQLQFLRRPAEVVLTGNRIHSIVDSRRQPEEATPVQVQILWLNHNRLSHVGAPAMGALAGTLVQLDLADNRLSSVEDVFVGCRLLSRLDLRQNALTQITSNTFRDLVSLRYLRLEDNLIASVSPDAFVRLQHLSYLVLKGNPIGVPTEQTAMSFKTDFLSYLDLSEAELEDVPLGLPPSVRYLQLRKNRLRVMTRKDFSGLRQLGILILDDNEIEEIEVGTFENLVHLSQLWMNGNRLTAVPSRLPSGVQRLLLDSNRIQTIAAQSLAGLQQVRTLSLMGNSIDGIEVGTFDVLSQLTSLDLSGNRISRIHPETFRQNNLIQVLHLSKNPLHSLDRGAFEGLVRLDQLSASYIPPSTSPFLIDALTDLQRLTRLDLDGSTDVIRALVTSGPPLRPLFLGLRDLSLAKSDLTALPSDFLSSLPQLTSLRISSDRWHCDRSLLWLRDWLANSSAVAKDDNRCLGPRHVTGRLLTSLADEEFAEPEIVVMASGDGKRHPLQADRSQPTVTVTTVSMASGDGGVDLRTRRPKSRTKDLPSIHAKAQTAGSLYDVNTDSIPEVRETVETDSSAPWIREVTAVTTPVIPTIVGQNSSLLSSYSGDDPSSGSFKLFHFNRTGRIPNPAGSDVTPGHGGNDVVEPAKNALSIDATVAIGTVTGTVVTAVVMVTVIVHLCRKEKAGVEPSSRVQKSSKQTAGGCGGQGEAAREVVYCTPDLYADAESARRKATVPRRDPVGSGRDRTSLARASDGGRHSTTRDADWSSAAGHKACWETGASEVTGLIGRMGDNRMHTETQMRVYKWEEL